MIYHYCISVTKDLTGFDLPALPAPKEESETENSVTSKPDLKELFFSIFEQVKQSLESLKKIIINEKNVRFFYFY